MMEACCMSESMVIKPITSKTLQIRIILWLLLFGRQRQNAIIHVVCGCTCEAQGPLGFYCVMCVLWCIRRAEENCTGS